MKLSSEKYMLMTTIIKWETISKSTANTSKLLEFMKLEIRTWLEECSHQFPRLES